MALNNSGDLECLKGSSTIQSDKLVFFETGVNQTDFIFLGSSDEGLRRIWKIQLCNCPKADFLKAHSMDSNIGKLACEPRSCTNSNRTCHLFEISWKQGLGLEKAKDACEKLWLAFEIAPAIILKPYLGKNIGLIFSRDYDEEELHHLEHLWKKSGTDGNKPVAQTLYEMGQNAKKKLVESREIRRGVGRNPIRVEPKPKD
eukprot:GHVP01064546.1.p1 GENE.GHVP01064546.1~~GHVP01064546.1.p1  ORF type:complete len:212 (-),score=17.87 GHVP01064546.1:114-716(-)